jgi:hypothetical protein
MNLFLKCVIGGILGFTITTCMELKYGNGTGMYLGWAMSGVLGFCLGLL